MTQEQPNLTASKDVLTAEEIMYKLLGHKGTARLLMPSLDYVKFKDEKFIPLSEHNKLVNELQEEIQILNLKLSELERDDKDI